jgi:hypothetical protein
MTSKPNPEQRDRGMERLVAEALRRAALADAVAGGACPDAETIAAYADQGLAADERQRLEGHFAACGQCQKVLAAVAVSGDFALANPEAVTATVAGSISSGPRARRSPQRWLWWLSPAFGAAAAALLWMALRPQAPIGTAPVQTAADYSRQAEQATDSLSAQTELPPRLAAEPPAERDRTARAPEAPSREVELSARASVSSQAKEEQAQGEAAVMSATAAAPSEAAPAAPTAEAAPPAAPTAGGETQGLRQADQAPQVGSAIAAFGTPRPELRARAAANGGEGVQFSLYTFASPVGSAIWRLGVNGSIQRSTDGGQTWQSQSSGVSADLIAGSAASEKVAWVAGRGGVILRTTDGEHWESIAPPSGFAGEWAAIVAHTDARATAIAEDLRSFSTQDGGRTWTLQ